MNRRIQSAEPLTHLVEEYLSYLYEMYPTDAAFDGIHTNDDLLENPSAGALEAQGRELGGFRRRFEAIGSEGLTSVERLERRMLEDNVRGRIFEQEELQSWKREPRKYAETLAMSLAGQMLFPYAPVEERARRILSKLRQVPRFIEAARTNIDDPPGIFVKIGATAFEGTLTFIERDLPKALSALDDPHLLGDLADASTEASQTIQRYLEYLRDDLAPRCRGSFRLGRKHFEEKLRLEEGITLEVDQLLAIGMRELRETQEEFRRVAGRLNGKDPHDAWSRVKDDHPSNAELVPVVSQQVEELSKFVERNAIVSIPQSESLVVAPTPEFFRWTFASMWTPGPFELNPDRAYYYITAADPNWPADRQNAHLRDFSHGALWCVSIHEAVPGHFLHFQHLRQVKSKSRKSILFSASSFIEGWAHYCEEMMINAGFGRGDDHIRLGQLAEALIRLARLVVGIKLHAEDYSVEQGVRFFRDEAFLEEGNARQEAERGTFDPSYIVYAVGKLMLLRLRTDYEAHRPAGYSLKDFHDTVLSNGAVPFWMHRKLMLGQNDGNLLD